jgi:phosphoribosylformylglycinamidine cyclo-ligase
MTHGTKPRLTYRDAGVDIDAGDALVERIRGHVRSTRRPEVLADVGGFAGLSRLPMGLRDPVLVSGTDGVGTKLKIAFALGIHDTLGIDLVAMCANDVVTVGADCLFFLDYFATGALDTGVAERVIAGVAEGCRRAGCALLGGETAEMPGMYAPNEYDLAGFCVGVVDRHQMLDGSLVKVGDVAIGLASSGLHSNGYALARKVLLDVAKIPLTHTPEGFERSLGETLLEPTHVYARHVHCAMATGQIHAIAHITGGGLPGNVPRVLPDGVGVLLDARRWMRPAVFDLIAREGNVEEHEMRRTFNLGLGMVIVAEAAGADAVMADLRRGGFTCSIVGEVVPSDAMDDARVTFVGD